MKLTIERAALLRALNHVQSVVERRNTIPILSNVLLGAEDNFLSLTATDMDLAVVERVEAEVATAGAVTAPAHTLYDITRKLPDGAQVEFNHDAANAQLVIKAGRSRFTLSTLPTDDFPAMSGGEMPHEFELGAVEIKSLIDRTKFAISTEETRYYLNGIYLHATEAGDVMRSVATDGHRLARVEILAPDGAKGMPGVIIPRKTVNELRKLIDETEGMVNVALSDTKIRFGFGNAVLTSKLIDGTFPDYDRVIPKGNDKSLVVDRSEFASAVDRVSTIATEKMRAIKIAIADKVMTLSASSTDNGTAVEELEIDYGADTMDIGFNARYLLDIAAQVESGKMEFVLADANSPTIVQDQEDTSALYVLMPMRV